MVWDDAGAVSVTSDAALVVAVALSIGVAVVACVLCANARDPSMMAVRALALLGVIVLHRRSTALVFGPTARCGSDSA